MRARILSWFAAMVLCACQGEGDPVNYAPAGGVCGFATGGTNISVVIDPNCDGCSVQNADLAADNDFNTFATVVVTNNVSNTGAAIRVTMADGSLFPAGRQIGYWAGQATGDRCAFVPTYLNGSKQEDGIGFCTSDPATGGSAERPTAKWFDAVELRLAGNATVNVQEICSDF